MQHTTARGIFKHFLGALGLITLLLTSLAPAQEQASVVPTLVNFSGTVTDVNGKPLNGTVGVTFFLYKDEQGGAPLWIETQNVQPDKYGHYNVTLGATKSQGLPTYLFASGEARWLGVQAQGQAEQPRIMLLAVPYALKAGDAQTIGGLPASAFVLAVPPASVSSTSRTASSSSSTTSNGVSPDLTGTGSAGFIPIWTSTTDLGNSAVFQSGSGATAKIGFGTKTPATTLDVKGTGTIRGLFNLPASGTATATAGFNSQALNLGASTFNSGTATAVNQNFRWQAEPVGNNTSSASGSLNLLFGFGSNTPAETGFKIASNGQLTFATGQSFPGTGTITGVTAGTDLTGGGSSGSVTLNLDTTKVPQLAASNSFNGNQTITGNLSDTGNISATGSITGKTATFSATNSTQVVSVTQSGTGSGIVATMPSVTTSFIPAILGNATNTSGYGVGVQGRTVAANGYGVYGWQAGTGGGGAGVVGVTDGIGGYGVYGLADSVSPGAASVGVEGLSDASNGIAVDGYEAGTNGIGVRGYTYGSSGIGVYGFWSSESAIGAGTVESGVWGDSSLGTGVTGTSDGGVAVFGKANSYLGVWGSSSSGEGVYGSSTQGTGVVGISTYNSGVYGFGDGVAGVKGEFYQSSVSGSGFTNVGVWGDTGTSGSSGVVGTADDGNAFFGKNNTAGHETLYVENDSASVGSSAARFAGPGSGTYCYIARDFIGLGDIICTGAKSAAVPVEGNRMVRLYAVEAADNWFEDAGSGQLANGSATVALDGVFAQTVNGDMDYHVFITPNGDCEGLYVAHKSAQGFEVHELRGGRSNIAFDYRIMAKRKGFENVHMQDVTADFERMKAESAALAARLEAGKQAEKARPPLLTPTLPKRSPTSSPRTPVHAPGLPVIARQIHGAGK